MDRRKEDAAGLLDYKLYWSGAVNDRSSSTEASYLDITVAAHRERILHPNYEWILRPRSSMISPQIVPQTYEYPEIAKVFQLLGPAYESCCFSCLPELVAAEDTFVSLSRSSLVGIGNKCI